MSIPTFDRPIRRRITQMTLPTEKTCGAKVSAAFASLWERFGADRDSSWAFSPQPEHLLAYATWCEALRDPEETAEVAVPATGTNR